MSRIPMGSVELDTILRERAESTAATIRHFGYGHLEGPAADVAKVFHDCAISVARRLPDGEALKFSLEHLLVARNAAVQAAAARPGV